MPISVAVGTDIYFQDTSSLDITAWSWMFGDGTTSTSQNPTKAYTDPGVYVVTLTATGPQGTLGFQDTVTVLGMLRAYWKLDEDSGTRVDSAGNYDLTPVNAPGSVAGKIDNAATFLNSSSQYLTNADFIPLDGSLGITIAAWINVRSGAPAGAVYFFDGLTFNDYIYLSTSNAGPKYIFCGAINTTGETTNAGVELAAYDTWYFVVGKYDPATGKTYLKIDNAVWIVGSDGLPAGLNVFSGAVYVGGKTPAFSRSYMDEVRVWNRILSDAEITARYALTATEVIDPVASALNVWTYPVPAYAEWPGTDPQIMLRISNDGGKTYVTEQWRSAGRVGEFFRRVRWNRLGSGRRRVFEVSVTDPAPWRITGAYLKANQGES